MTFYDHFSQKEKRSTRMGLRLVKYRDRRILKILLKNAKNKDDIDLLEVGPGRGIFYEVCKEEKINYTAMEVNPTLADNLKKRGARIIRTKVPPLSLESNRFDIVFMNQLFEHMNSLKQAQSLMEEYFRVLKKGGLLTIISPDYLAWKEEFFNGDYTHNYVTTARRLKGIYHDNNLKTVCIHYLSGPIWGETITLALSFLARVLIRSKLLSKLSLGSISEERIYKVKVSLLRSFMIVGEKE